MQQPVISIITITFNNLSGLKNTLESVSKLGINNFENIIIDGKSNDGTVEFLKAYKLHPIQFTSEIDDGIYDAMNKGAKKASGEWIIFMNAGDCFINNVGTLFNLSSSADVMYGSSNIKYSDGFERTQQPVNIEQLWKGMSFTHQSVLLRTEIFKANEFNLRFQFCADFDQLFRLYNSNYKFEEIPFSVCTIEAGGISDLKRYKATYEVYQINQEIAPRFVNHPYFISKIVWGFIISTIKSILPKKARNYLTRKKYR